MELHKGCLREAPLRGAEAEGAEAGGIEAGGIGARAFQASILGQALDDPGKICLWK